MTRFIALLDRPSPKSFGLVPVITERHGVPAVTGVAGLSAHRVQPISIPEVNNLIAAGHALRVTGELSPADDVGVDTVALWAGTAFLEAAERADLLPAPLPSRPHPAEGGSFYLGRAAALYPYLDQWVSRALTTLLNHSDQQKQRHIAELMRWVLPSNPMTLAALWTSSSEPDTELRWQVQSAPSRVSPKQLITTHADVLARHADPFRDIRLVAFTGGTETNRDIVAKQFADLSRTVLTTFERPLKELLNPQELVDAPERKASLMEIGQREVEHSPLNLTLRALGAEDKSGLVVLDSVRHASVYEVLRWLRPKKLVLVSVDINLHRRRERLQARKLDPDEFLNDPTEREIPAIAAKADLRIDGESLSHPELNELLRQVTA